MTTSERKRRERQEREHLFLQAASEMIERHGFLNLHMAKLAKQCQYATGTLYQHFSSREDLLAGIVGEQAAWRMEVFEKIASIPINGRDKMLTIVIADRLLQQHNPQHAKLEQYVFTEAVWENVSQHQKQKIFDCCKPIGDLVSQITQEALIRGDLPNHGYSPMDLSLAPWAQCQGYHALVNAHGLLEAFAVVPDPMLLYRNITMLLNGMEWQPLLPVEDKIILNKVTELKAELEKITAFR
ncbi:TetR/AcrR family transcriptional regulator [Vibrio cincinnatiensis]|uniref:Transcriptional regulator, TetR family n=1 Tax=Vibrio cincinnatiensis DSM 19608 TaxID=1123491 RepID=A0A1T4KWJ8_VIBCI|nr:TetR/AcrR family transcriptional regulator [Vibrio cincinnatiensis]MCG3726759.1 TetR/AcrR family transcriptional regulator [Vibrio cincinnatiensis]MCG3733497.1 TetR/AcrR family transcriptional regulator [Vibrio cincinnatiensis]MCG3740827.1 TetR/AcrR family transcriptional regulator [Vibrio cincinnatiensis]MCG3744363.1 TetR/AcrR family transcriptional regulator [Vibrio cincinnatiensis]MCG3747952.1 TetR/AcrR family transcriptional regulator [Vibrio cincinnatiensis]